MAGVSFGMVQLILLRFAFSAYVLVVAENGVIHAYESMFLICCCSRYLTEALLRDSHVMLFNVSSQIIAR